MRSLLLAILLFGMQSLCYGQKTQQNKDNTPLNYKSFGQEITPDEALSQDAMYSRYRALSLADSINAKFNGTVTDVCSKKGCWMKLQLPDGRETMVRFKDYGFFVPKDITGKEVVVQGTAFVEEISVEDRRHYAMDGGASKEEVAKITEPLTTYGFEAVGVLLEK